jgi:hypothetical protein
LRFSRQQLLDHPNFSKLVLNENPENNNGRICAPATQPTKRMSLDAVGETKEANWHDADSCFEIKFVVYSLRPADWDGYDFKALQDFFVTAGIIPDDRWDIIFGGAMSRKAATKDAEKTEIEITEL